jgi:alcohol dehydrogenase YqhD (iron-dependent ADH family)
MLDLPEERVMNSFEFYNPVRIVFGPGSAPKAGALAARHGRKAVVVTTRGSLRRLGILDKVIKALDEAGVQSTVLDGVDPNPRLKTVYEGVKICREFGADMLVAVGGGSVIDCAKAIAAGVFDDGDIWDFFMQKRQPQRALPVLCVLTISGTGSEMNANCVITNEQTDQKYVLRSPLIYPKVSVIDPELMVSVPRHLTACGMVDTISHVLEKYFDGTPDTPLQDRMAEGVVQTVLESAAVLERPDDVTLRGVLAWASSLALCGLCDSGRGMGAFDAHTIELEISARYDVAHGAGLAAVHPAWMEHLCRKGPEKFAQFAGRIFGIQRRSNLEAGLEGISALREQYRKLGMPVTLREMGVTKESLREIALAAQRSPRGGHLDPDDVLDVLTACW